MAAAKHNIILGRGEDYVATLAIKTEGGTPVNITDNNFKGQIRRGAGKPLITSFVFTITDDVGGVVKIKLPLVNSLKLDPNITYQYDIFRYDDEEGDNIRLLSGSLIAEGNITEPTT